MSITEEVKLDFEDSTKANGKYLVFDVETTGLPINRYASPNDFKNWPYVVQIAWLLFDDEHKLIEHNNFYLKQPVEIPTDATNIHGITTAIMLEKGIEPSNAYAIFKKVIDNTEYLICHNIDFERLILDSKNIKPDKDVHFIYVNDPNEIIEEIRLDPRIDTDTETLQQITLKKLGFKGIVAKSKLYSYNKTNYKININPFTD